jgi:hypothetical protein
LARSGARPRPGAPVGTQQRGDPRKQSSRGSSNTNIAVQQQRAPPRSAAGKLVEDRSDNRAGAPTGCQFDSHRREVDAERKLAACDKRAQMAARSAADVEYRTADAAQHLLVDCVRVAEIAIERERQDRPIAEPQASAWAALPGSGRPEEAVGVQPQRVDHRAIAASDAAKREPGATLATA